MALPFGNGKTSDSTVIREGGYQPTSDPGPLPRSLVRRAKDGAPGRGDWTQVSGPSPALDKAFANPDRVSILRALSKRDATAAELAPDLNLDLSQVAYHLKALQDWEIIEVVGEEVRRGHPEHRFRARPDAIRPVLEMFAQESARGG